MLYAPLHCQRLEDRALFDSEWGAVISPLYSLILSSMQCKHWFASAKVVKSAHEEVME
jgi:hypothetical protein